MDRGRIAVFSLAVVFLIIVAAGSTQASERQLVNPRLHTAGDISNIQHIVIVMQENRSFDHYFGTYTSPNPVPQTVDGLPRKPNGDFTSCVPDPALGHCSTPYHSTTDFNLGGPHSLFASRTDVNGGKMNGFIDAVTKAGGAGGSFCANNRFAASCKKFVGPKHQPDVMSFHTGHEIGNYWNLADNYVLQDHLYEPVDSWTVPSHLYMVSAWSATCRNYSKPMSCRSDPRYGPTTPKGGPGKRRPYAWTDITYLLSKNSITWTYYVGDGTCLRASCAGDPKPASATTPGWNPLLGFTDITEQPQSGAIKWQQNFFADVSNNTLPQVSWVVPGANDSEHPGKGSLNTGVKHVTHVLNAIGANQTIWDSTAIFLAWDDWGGFYDHEKPIHIDGNGYGIRVPGLMISPYAQTAYVDHTVLSSDAYLRFIEDRFLLGQRLNPNTDGRPDSRPNVREESPKMGNVMSEFDFTQPPRPWTPLPQP